jgi:hypothetical protein
MGRSARGKRQGAAVRSSEDYGIAMNLDVIRHFLIAEPFEPIEIRLANGDRHEVRDPVNMAVGKNVVVILHSDSNRMALYAASCCKYRKTNGG